MKSHPWGTAESIGTSSGTSSSTREHQIPLCDTRRRITTTQPRCTTVPCHCAPRSAKSSFGKVIRAMRIEQTRKFLYSITHTRVSGRPYVWTKFDNKTKRKPSKQDIVNQDRHGPPPGLLNQGCRISPVASPRCEKSGDTVSLPAILAKSNLPNLNGTKFHRET